MSCRILPLVSLLFVIGCGGSSSDETQAASAEVRCSPGIAYSCVRWNCSGYQRCQDDGKLSACVCSATDASVLLDAAAVPVDRDSGQPTTSTMPTMSPALPQDSGVAPPRDAGTPRDAGMPPDAGPRMQPDAAAPAAPEQCDNGKDDDGDGNTDCADADCGQTRCVAAAPAGWQGPVAFRLATEAISCNGSLDSKAFEAGDQPEATPATCSACSCEGGGCSQFLDFGTSAAAECGGASCTTSVSASCVEIRPQCLQNATTASLKPALPPGSSTCTPSEQQATVAPAGWKTRVTACAPSMPRSAGCSGGQVCLPEPAQLGFEGAYCVWREGDVACPSDTFTRRRVYYRELTDTRACSPCACAAPSCSYSWRVFNPDDASCASPLLELSSVDQCAQINPEMGRLRVGATISSAGACVASGGESQGNVVADGAISLCCDG